MTRIVGHYVIGFPTRAIAIVMALHATKGWHRPFEAPRRHFPEYGWKGNNRRRVIEPTDPLPGYRLMPKRITPIPITEAMLMRHGWYRRKARNELTREIMLEAAQ